MYDYQSFYEQLTAKNTLLHITDSLMTHNYYLKGSLFKRKEFKNKFYAI